MTNPTHALELPPIGLGCWSLNGADGAAAVQSGLETGYRLLDTAYSYENEGAVGRGIRDSGVPREEITITSKLAGRYQQPGHARAAIEESTYRLGVDHLDLLLIHWPNPQRGFAIEAWHQLVHARDEGLVHHIGVSNFLPEHLDKLIKATDVVPEVNQIELHPLIDQSATLEYCAENDIQIEAWSPLGRGGMLDNPTLKTLARIEGMEVGELILAWHAAIGSIPLARSANPLRQEANLEAVSKEISEETLAEINKLGTVGGYLWEQDPRAYEEW